MGKLFIGLLLFIVGFNFPLSPSEEKQLIRDIAEIKATLKVFMHQTDKRFEEMFTFLWIITGIFTTLTVSVIGIEKR